MTAKVTFGNINGVDSPATHITLHDAPQDQVTTMYSTASSTSAAEGLKQRRQGSSSSQTQESSVDPTVCINHKQQQYNKVCHISDDCFKVPSDFRRIHNNMIGQNEEEELLQLAIQQSLLMQQQQQPENVREALGHVHFLPPESKSPHEHQQDQMAHDEFDDDLAIAIALSLGDQETPATSTSESSQLQQQDSTPLSSQLAHLSEDEIFKQILKLSLTEK